METTLKQMKEELFKQGFRSSYPHSDYTMVQFTDKLNRNHQIYLDEKSPNKVTTWRITRPKTIIGEGVVGNFVGGGASQRRFSFKTIEKLIEKLESYSSHYDSYN